MGSFSKKKKRRQKNFLGAFLKKKKRRQKILGGKKFSGTVRRPPKSTRPRTLMSVPRPRQNKRNQRCRSANKRHGTEKLSRHGQPAEYILSIPRQYRAAAARATKKEQSHLPGCRSTKLTFEDIKGRLTRDLGLCHFDSALPTTLVTDASRMGIGFALMQSPPLGKAKDGAMRFKVTVTGREKLRSNRTGGTRNFMGDREGGILPKGASPTSRSSQTTALWWDFLQSL